MGLSVWRKRKSGFGFASRSRSLLLSTSTHRPSSHLLTEREADGLLDKIHALNNFRAEHCSSLRPLRFCSETVGYVSKALAHILSKHFPDVYRQTATGIDFSSSFIAANSCEERTKILSHCNAQLRDGIAGDLAIRGWRNELLPVSTHFHRPALFLLERALCPLFGARAFGVHVNGFVGERDPWDGRERATHLFVARRARAKASFPAARALSAGERGQGVRGGGREIALRAACTGAVFYNHFDPQTEQLQRDSLFCFDLRLPKDFQPVPRDGEVESFALVEINSVLDLILKENPSSDEMFKPNTVLVFVDFFIRHGLIDPHSARYLDIVSSLRNGSY